MFFTANNPASRQTVTSEFIKAFAVAKTCTLNGRFRFSFTLLNITTAAKTTTDTVKINILALLSFFLMEGANILYCRVLLFFEVLQEYHYNNYKTYPYKYNRQVWYETA